MIVLEVSDTAVISYYDVLELAFEERETLNRRTIRKKADLLARQYSRAANAGDQEAHEKMTLVNTAKQTLMDEQKRKAHDEELEGGKGAAVEIMRPQRVSPAFFWDRNVRFQVIERLLREAGWSQPITLDLEGVPA